MNINGKFVNWDLARSINEAYQKKEISRDRYIYEYANWQRMFGLSK